MKMMQKMKVTVVAELTQMDHLQNDLNQHLSNSFYEIKTANKLRCCTLVIPASSEAEAEDPKLEPSSRYMSRPCFK